MKKSVLLETLHKSGIVINWDKSLIMSEFIKEYIGYSINSQGPDNVPWIAIPLFRQFFYVLSRLYWSIYVYVA